MKGRASLVGVSRGPSLVGVSSGVSLVGVGHAVMLVAIPVVVSTGGTNSYALKKILHVHQHHGRMYTVPQLVTAIAI